MSKRETRLNLSRETVRELSRDDQLDQVAGGHATLTCPLTSKAPTFCGPTCLWSCDGLIC